MKINKNYIVKGIADETIIVPIGESAQYFNGLISTNQVAGFIWQNMEKVETVEEMVALVCEHYDGDINQIKEDVEGFINTLKEVGMIEE